MHIIQTLVVLLITVRNVTLRTFVHILCRLSIVSLESSSYNLYVVTSSDTFQPLNLSGKTFESIPDLHRLSWMSANRLKLNSHENTSNTVVLFYITLQ